MATEAEHLMGGTMDTSLEMLNFQEFGPEQIKQLAEYIGRLYVKR